MAIIKNCKLLIFANCRQQSPIQTDDNSVINPQYGNGVFSTFPGNGGGNLPPIQ